MRGVVEIELDKKRNLRYTMNAVCEFEDLIDRPLSQLEKDLSMSDMRAMIWCGLKHEDESLTLHDVGEMLDMANIGDVMDVVMDAFGKAVKKNGGKMAKAINARSGIGNK